MSDKDSTLAQFDVAGAERLEKIYLTPDVVQQREQIFQLLDVKPGMNALDIGCGPGLTSLALAHAVGSTSAILKAAQTMDASTFIVATDNGMLHKLRTLNPGKTFIEAPTAGNSATCKSCAQCPWMAMNGLADVARMLETGANAIEVDAAIIPRARLPIDRMLAFTAALKNGQPVGGLIPHLGAA
jgi:quinolinate synthase